MSLFGRRVKRRRRHNPKRRYARRRHNPVYRKRYSRRRKHNPARSRRRYRRNPMPAILPAGITKDPPATMRTTAMAVLTPLFSAAGIVVIGTMIRNELTRRRFYYPAVVGALLLTSFAVTYRYSRSEYFRELSFQEIGVRMGKALGGDAGGYDEVILGPHVSQAYLYIAAFSPITPEQFHQMPKRLYSIGMDRYTQMGKYHFVTESMMAKSVDELRGHGRVLFVTPQKMPGLAVVDSVRFRDDALYFSTY